MSDVLGTVRSYADLHELMRVRADALEITRERIDEIAGLQPGYAAKLLAPRPMKKLGDLTMGLILPALGMKLVVVVDEEAMRQIRTRLVKRELPSVLHTAAVQFKVSRRFLRKIARKGGSSSRKYVGKRRSKQLARKAARARWAKSLVDLSANRAGSNGAGTSAAGAPAFPAPRTRQKRIVAPVAPKHRARAR